MLTVIIMKHFIYLVLTAQNLRSGDAPIYLMKHSQDGGPAEESDAERKIIF